ncbi:MULTISPECIES: Tim44/TimA family putative adaptor protein [Pseudorhizobium]|uniref:Calcium-binding protein n=1 Tax=Pseudorhizobium pelagicum TaxID=1509405 RepID=A0A922P2I9_9HYPH|nr:MULTISPECIES: Tim44/TimA family putative adaptor protein [Pseudorhizobium]MBU1312745.1 Tim44/TimA family putative adaptor protein [Alphaproteobacteria bacterium]MDY6962931.1 Tim44/TimA family putative adaptor protein [Pseudomonadota bacterium]KEQ03329.1 calcium-binding protein [Pseudorhizobium pelagicum]KEQ05118.1 calcium-binding protein [Pseudorhizobium pelagicum]MBU1548597.1 Tim44/TimA family putative adaptor protein [Alphaproteobacteria bacterium]|tara:strand:- start:2402 stop:3097 length:696 start_codon:yes stop_codon:yes gene_type:complete
MGSNDFITLFFLVAAVLIFLQLRNVLGRRTGNEKPPFDPYTARDAVKAPASDDGKVVTLPRREISDEERFSEIDAVAKQGTPLNASLREMLKVDPSFKPAEFLNGARMAYEMIVMAFADGDRKTLKNLLSKEVYEGFDAAISEREAKGEVVKSTFVGIDKAELTHASVKGPEEQVTVRIVCQLISATFDKDGAIVDGDQENVAEVTDIWTFARDSRSRDPNWKLVATESEQ